jgi:hypothetical protein
MKWPENWIRTDNKGDWYFWDETGAHDCGPFKTKEEAVTALKEYAKWLNGELNDQEK